MTSSRGTNRCNGPDAQPTRAQAAAGGLRKCYWYGSLIVSTAVHIGLIAVLACCWVTVRGGGPGDVLDSRWSPYVEELEETVEPMSLESVAPPETRQTWRSSASQARRLVAAWPAVRRPVFPVPAPDAFSGAASQPSVPGADDLAGPVDTIAPTPAEAEDESSGSGDAYLGGKGTGGGFFGVESQASRCVYVLDASRSMNHPDPTEAHTRFRRIKLELISSIAAMDPRSKFFMVFFNDQAIPMPASMLQPASMEAKRRYLGWMQRLRADGGTDPTAAFALALRLRPEVIYFLTDGYFPKKIQDALQGLSLADVTVHTFSFETELDPDVQAAKDVVRASGYRAARRRFRAPVVRKANKLVRAEQFLRDLAARSGGQYHLIP